MKFSPLKMFRFFLALLIFPFFLLAQENEKQLWQDAQTFYESGDYLSALAIYEQLLEDAHSKNIPLALVHHNLANTHAQIFFQNRTMTPNKHIAKALWHYEKSLQLDPSNHQAKAHLKKIEKYLHLDEYQIAKDADKVPKKTLMDQKKISSASGFFLVVASLLFFLSFILARKKKILRVLLFISLSIYGLLAIFLFRYQTPKENPTHAIVAENNTKLYQDEESTDQYTLILPVGVKVQITRQTKNKALVHFERKIFTHWQKFDGWIDGEKLLKY